MRLGRRGRREGFTLIELLIVVAIIGVIAGILIPYLMDALQKGKQKRTVGDMRNVGTCWMSWLTDQVGAGAAGSSAGARTYDLSVMTQIDRTDLFHSLYLSQDFYYCNDIPGYDGWGYGFEYYQNDTLLAANNIAIRSAGGDGVFDTDVYPVGPFVSTSYYRDLLWADGMFVRYPAGVLASAAAIP